MAERSRRSHFGPAVLAGLGSAALLAVASNQKWAIARPSEPGVAWVDFQEGSQVPLALALALVVLAAWGVLLVTRGVVRVVVAALALIASLGAVVTVVSGRGLIVESYRDSMADIGATPVVDFTVWWWIALVAAVLSALASAFAVRRVRSWPEMGSRYDAPGSTREPTPSTDAQEDPDSLALWKAIDEGRDPTT